MLSLKNVLHSDLLSDYLPWCGDIRITVLIFSFTNLSIDLFISTKSYKSIVSLILIHRCLPSPMQSTRSGLAGMEKHKRWKFSPSYLRCLCLGSRWIKQKEIQVKFNQTSFRVRIIFFSSIIFLVNIVKWKGKWFRIMVF